MVKINQLIVIPIIELFPLEPLSWFLCIKMRSFSSMESSKTPKLPCAEKLRKWEAAAFQYQW